ncbi:hypothetical protein PIB30_088688 [Stylosanthes scabra]|uniref:Uncharacterized protein n=1 Tax=Stylosanthes scabra TaxID=79078 RepID=A0ABU6SU47_9FABA|nr:hypothetical protein [Stylosanthes scabra]
MHDIMSRFDRQDRQIARTQDMIRRAFPHADFTGNYKEKKLGAKHNLKKEEELKNQGNFKAGYRYPRRKPTPNHVQAWIGRDPRPNPC